MKYISPLLDRLERTFKTDIRYFISGNAWLTFSRAMSIVTGLALTTALANLLPPATYGFLDFSMAAASIIAAFSLTGLGTAIANGVARGDDGVFRETFRKGFKWSMVGSAIALAAAAFYLFKHDIQTSIAFFIIAVATPVSLATGNYKAYLVGKKDFKSLSLYGTTRSIITVAAMIATAVLTNHPITIVAAYFFSNMVVSSLIYMHIVRRYRIPARAQDTESVMHFAKHTSVIGFLSQLSSQADQLLIWHYMGAADVAVYSLATSPVEELKNIPGNIFSIATPKFAARRGEDMRHMLWLRMKQMFLLVSLIAFVYIVAAPVLFTTLFPKYAISIVYTQIYALVLLFQPQGFLDAALVAKEDIHTRRKLTIANQVIKIGLLAIGIANFGIWGGIAALIIAEAANLALFSLALRKV